jgi:phthalate 4,5-cis-dihydrodiol dehydrogenase
LKRLGLGIAGLGRAFSLMAPTFAGDPRLRIVAGSDPREEARRQFERDFGARAYAGVEALCADEAVEALYVATPHQFHAAHVAAAAAAGKHLLVEKPMALSLDECRAMIAAARQAGVHLLVGHSHSFDAPIRLARSIVEDGTLGAVRMIHALNYTDFLYRPRRPEELDTASGGGVVFNQAAHHVDVVRLLAGSPVRSVRAVAGAWDAARSTEGAYAALLMFESGCVASLVYSGYAHFDSDELMDWMGELGARKEPAGYGAARKLLQADELALKNARNYGGASFRGPPAPQAHQHFGPLIVSCERGDLRPLPHGVMIYGDGERRLEALPAPRLARLEVVDELYAAAVDGRAPLHSGEWAMETLSVCLAILRSSKEQREIAL